jgi:hypothetical protein
MIGLGTFEPVKMSGELVLSSQCTANLSARPAMCRVLGDHVKDAQLFPDAFSPYTDPFPRNQSPI